MAAMEIMTPTAVPEKEPEAPGLPDLATGMFHCALILIRTAQLITRLPYRPQRRAQRQGGIVAIRPCSRLHKDARLLARVSLNSFTFVGFLFCDALVHRIVAKEKDQKNQIVHAVSCHACFLCNLDRKTGSVVLERTSGLAIVCRVPCVRESVTRHDETTYWYWQSQQTRIRIFTLSY